VRLDEVIKRESAQRKLLRTKQKGKVESRRARAEEKPEVETEQEQPPKRIGCKHSQER
jgi:hypothetical protein